ncbi:MAG TPA: translation initiation factor Sui1 [Candidatus Rifleibacterium sp.]|nr:translation initiation factor Sui1 [Candidatus Rifleibacterium sp.]HPT46769.1 translation initiation factor Sui1 [Candidatus Rifleibacterium sp.]
MSKNQKGGLVYSSEWGRMCPDCEQPVEQCRCRKQAAQTAGPATGRPADGIVRVSRETKGRKGSGVTLISGLPGGEEGLKKLAAELKKKCGAGGAIKDGVIEIQGDHRDRLIDELQKLGYKVKRCGG